MQSHRQLHSLGVLKKHGFWSAHKYAAALTLGNTLQYVSRLALKYLGVHSLVFAHRLYHQRLTHCAGITLHSTNVNLLGNLFFHCRLSCHQNTF